jgi:diaminohydroxyphosphoribosylaminopyrimidine deaminase/5-amino-6-(5-phosphoribosylamino)uracil reductase
MTPDFDITTMRRAIDLAMRGRGSVEPNPMVGCVIGREGRIIGQGWHQRYGGPHAEVEALRSCVESPQGADVYVTLEPCCHTNKQTPPCVPQLIGANVARVVVGCVDPNPAVSGRGAAQLREAGIAVESSSLEKECRQLIAPFTARVVHQRPYVTLKWAQSADGKVAGEWGKRVQISNEASMRQVHELRARSDAILVGSHTAVRDDPQLTARPRPSLPLRSRTRPIIRVVLDKYVHLEASSRLATTARQVPTWLYCTIEAGESERAMRLAERGVVLKGVSPVNQRIPLMRVLNDLGAEKITHLTVEAGPSLARSFIDGNLADRIWVFYSPMWIGGAHAPLAASVDWPVSAQLEMEGDQLVEYLNPNSAVFFHLDPSADVAMASWADQG